MEQSLKRTSIVLSVVAILLCVVLAVGSTFSLFTSKTDGEINVTAGEVKVTASLGDLKTWSLGEEQVANFANLGKATIDGAALTLKDVTPGDKAQVNIKFANDSTVAIAYRLSFALEGTLADALKISITRDGKTLPLATPSSEWYYTTAAKELLPDVTVSIELPKTVGDDYQGKDAKITFQLDAVQANAVDEEVATADQLMNAITFCDRATLVDDVTLVEDLVIPAGKTFALYLGNNTLNTNGNKIINNGNLTIDDVAPVKTSRAMRQTSAAGEILGTVVNNGVLTVKDTAVEVIENAGAATISDAVIATIDNTAANAALVVASGIVDEIIADEKADIVITDGTFGFEVPHEWLEDGLGSTEDENGNFITAPATVMIGNDGYVYLKDAAAKAKAGDEIRLLENQALTADVTLPSGVILNGNGKSVTGATVWAAGDLTFKGTTKLAGFNAGYNKGTITIGKNTYVEIVSAARIVIGHGATFNIEGNVVNAKTANAAALKPSLVMPGASFTGAGVNFNVKNAYVKTNSQYSSSSKTASGTFNFNIENSIWQEFNKLAFEANSTAATVNFELKNSVLTTTSHLVFGVTKGEIVIDNSNVNVGKNYQLENRSTMTIKNGSVVYGALATSSNAQNPGKTVVDNATYVTTGEFSGATVGTGILEVRNGAKVTVPAISNANVTVDTESQLTISSIKAGATLTVDAANWNGRKALVLPGDKAAALIEKIAVVNAKPETELAAIEGGVAFRYIPKGSVTLALTSTTGFWGEGRGNAQESLVFTIYEGDKAIVTASLNNVNGIFDGDVYVTWNMPFAGSNDAYWTVEWADNYPNVKMNPTKITVTVDGEVVGENALVWSAADGVAPIKALVEKDGKFVGAFGSVADAAKQGYGAIRLTPKATEAEVAAAGLKTVVIDGYTYAIPATADAVITTADELLALSGKYIVSNNGKAETYTVILLSDIDLGGKTFAEIGVAYGDTLNFLGNGYTIKNFKLTTGNHNGMTNVGMFYADEGATLNVSNLKLVNVTADGIDALTTGAAAVVGYSNGTVNLNNVDIDGASVINTFGNAAIYVGYTVSPVNLIDCDVVNATVAGNKADKTGIFVATANTTGCVFTITNCTNGTDANDFGRILANAKVTVDGAVVLVANALTHSEGNVYNVLNEEGFIALHKILAENKGGRYAVINILADLDMSGDFKWTPVRAHIDWNSNLKAIYGNGHTIKNLTINGQAMFSVFASVAGDKIEITNLTFDNATVNSTSINTSILVVQTYQSILLDNVDVKNSTITGGYKVAPLIATVYDEKSTTITATLKNCDVSNTTVKALTYDFCTTGLVAFVNAGNNDKVEFENCTVTDVAIYGPTTYGYKAHAWVYTTGSETLFNEANGVTVSGCTFENI